MSTSTSGIQIATFSGTSTYSAAFQQVLSRTVNIAGLPAQLMQNQINHLTSQQQALGGLLTTFAQLQGAIQSVASVAKGNITANVSDKTILSASATASAAAASYTVEVDDIGSAAMAISNAGVPPVTDPTVGNVSTAQPYTLSINGVAKTPIIPAGNSLQDLADAINSADDGVQATIINVGGTSGMDYRITLTSTTLGANTIELTDSTNAVLSSQLADGSDVLYRVNGSAQIHSNTTNVTLAPGLTANLLSENPLDPVTVTVGNDSSSLSSALNGLAISYNAAVDALAQQRGQSGGALTGQSIVSNLQHMMSDLAHYDAGSGSISTLVGLGLEVDSTGHMQFNSTTFAGFNTSDIQTFLGGATSGGFLQAANDALNSVTDTANGSLETTINTLQDRITQDHQSILDLQDRVTNLQNSLLAQLSKADAALAVLEHQKTYFTDLFAATYNNNNGASTG